MYRCLLNDLFEWIVLYLINLLILNCKLDVNADQELIKPFIIQQSLPVVSARLFVFHVITRLPVMNVNLHLLGMKLHNYVQKVSLT